MAALFALAPIAVFAAEPPVPAPATQTVAQSASGPLPQIPTNLLGKLQFISQPQLSPDGLHIAAFVTVNNHTVVGVFDLDKGTNKLINAGDKLDMRWFRWAGNDRVLISIGKMVPWYGDDALQTRLIAHEISTNKIRFIGGKEEGLDGDDILWVDPEGKSILLSYQKTIYDYPSVSSIDLATNRSKTVWIHIRSATG